MRHEHGNTEESTTELLPTCYSDAAAAAAAVFAACCHCFRGLVLLLLPYTGTKYAYLRHKKIGVACRTSVVDCGTWYYLLCHDLLPSCWLIPGGND